MAYMKTLIIFDLDGTLLDTSYGIFETANITMKELGYKTLNDEQLRRFVGPPLAECFDSVCKLDNHLVPKAVEIYRKHYEISGGKFKAKKYPGIKELLIHLKEEGYLLAVGTLKLESLAHEVLEHFDLDHYFDIVIGADPLGQRTKADIINVAIESLGLNDKTKVIMVGDTPHDLEGSKKANVPFVAVSWGFGDFSSYDLTKETHMVAMIDKPQELVNYIGANAN
jgi:phosphoglycolate phosphatase